MLAVIFNGLLVALPILAAYVVAAAFSSAGFGQSPTPEALTETRRNIERSFEKMSPNPDTARAVWGEMVERELNDRNISAARGFLLAAPHMLDNSNSRAVRAAAEAEISGTEDERLARAALLFLPNDVRARYLAASAPPSIDMPPPTVETEAPGSDSPAADTGSETSPETDQPLATRSLATRPVASVAAFSMLGSLEDLAANSRRWINGDTRDSFVLRLTGLGMVSPETASGVNLPEAASILKAARRANRLSPDYLRTLESRLNAAIPEDTLRPLLEEALSEVAPMSVLGEKVKQAFAESIDTRHLPRLALEMEMINRIADATSPAGAISLLEHVEGGDDMRRARLVAEAGGDRAAALIKQLGPKALDTAEAGIKWTRMLVLQVMGLAAAALALVFTLLTTISRSVSERPRRAAIY